MGPVLTFPARWYLDLLSGCRELGHDQRPLPTLRIDLENPSNKLDSLSHKAQTKVDMGVDRIRIKPNSVVFNAYAEISVPV